MGPYFETWKHQTLVRFAKESYEKLQRQEEELQRLRLELRQLEFDRVHEALEKEAGIHVSQQPEQRSCPSCAKLKTKVATLEQGIRQVGTALKEAMT